MEVFFIDFLRPEQKFDSLDAMLAQIRRDEVAAREKLGL
jgi:FAD synthase